MSDKKTNAMRLLDTEKIPYQVHTYDASDGQIDGVSVAEKCGENPDQVYKTLVCQGDDRSYDVFVVPVAMELDLKACARSVGQRSVAMIHVKDLLKVTGYIRGGCSPIGMRKKFVTVYDQSILQQPTVLVSGGRIGLQIELKPQDLIQASSGIVAEIARHS